MGDFVIQDIPWFWRLNPATLWARAGAGFPNKIYLSKELREDLGSDAPSLYVRGVIEHEKKHLERMHEVGQLMFRFKYAVSPVFRFQEELIAERARFSFLKREGGSIDLVKQAKRLSGPLYWWMISEKRALAELENLWDIV